MSFRDNYGNQVVRQTIGLMNHNVGYTSALSYPEQPDPLAHAGMISDEVIPVLLRAEKAREWALSHRGFGVGSGAVAIYRRKEMLRKHYIHGANAKPVPGSDIINIHAEHTVMQMAELGKLAGETLQRIPIMGVVGPYQADQQSGRESLTLHSCGVCRDATYEEGSPIDDLSLTVTALPDFTAIEWATRAALRAFHVDGDDSGIGRATFDRRSPMLIVPERIKEAERTGQPVVLSDYEDDEPEAEAEFNEKVRYPILDYMLRAQGSDLRRVGDGTVSDEL